MKVKTELSPGWQKPNPCIGRRGYIHFRFDRTKHTGNNRTGTVLENAKSRLPET